MIIALCGKKGCGKDTFAQFLCKYIDCQQLSFAGPIKGILQDIYGFSPEDIEYYKRTNKSFIFGKRELTLRQFMQEFGEHMKFIDPEIWAKALRVKINPNKINIITDLRFPIEYEYLKELNLTVVKIERENMQMDAHISETSVNYIIPHCVVVNNGSLGDLAKKAQEFAHILLANTYKN